MSDASYTQVTGKLDLINRQDAIEAVMNTEPVVFDVQTLEPHQKTKDVIAAIEAVPSAEPEIIRCKDCRFFKRNIPCTGGRYNGCEMWLDDGSEIRVMTDDYCSKALPKEGEQDG